MHNTEHQKFIAQALELSKKALPDCLPNPAVGCVIVRDNQIVASGYTQKYGSMHAEAMALSNLTGDLSDCIVYVTLEPCSFYGKTPSCAQALIDRNVSKIYIHAIDPDPRNNGKGVKMLKDAGAKIVR